MKPRVAGFCCLHYGRDYLKWAIMSVIDSVDEMHCIYSPVPSHGANSGLTCPETREELLSQAQEAAGNKLVWTEREFGDEVQHRDHIWEITDAPITLVVDADEVYPDGLADELIEVSEKEGLGRLRVPFVHFYRSFHWAILHDPAYPVRLYNLPKIETDEGEWHQRGSQHIAHFGAALPVDVMRYKLSIHGHINELRPEYLDDIYIPNRRTDCHCVGSIYWNAERVDPSHYVPAWMSNHPYWNLEVIDGEGR